jgi:recombination protein RecA
VIVAARAAVRTRTKLDDAAPIRGRVRLEVDNTDTDSIGQGSTYYSSMENDDIDFVHAGCAVFDAMCGGGYPLGRVVNIVGDKSAGKTLLTMEAFANFHMQWPAGLMRYGESEHAFDEPYAEAIGIPMGTIEMPSKETVPVKRITLNRDEDDDGGGKRKPLPYQTIEDFAADLEIFCDKCIKRKVPGIYAIDSLDALSDEAEMGRSAKLAKLRAREPDDDDDEGGRVAGTYGAAKAKQMSEMFRRLVHKIEEANVLLIVVSQLRDNIGAMFGEKKKRSGGMALDYYASIVVWVREKAKIKQTQNGITRIIGVDIHARVKKNKVGLPFRECLYPILFGYGIDDLTADVEWLFAVKRDAILRDTFAMSASGYKVRLANLRNKGGAPVADMRKQLREVVFKEWRDIETGFLPKARKY